MKDDIWEAKDFQKKQTPWPSLQTRLPNYNTLSLLATGTQIYAQNYKD